MKIVYRIGVVLVMLLLAIACVVLYHRYHKERHKTKELEEELASLTVKEKRTAVMQSINAQMEEIANQQWAISDEQRKEAVQQTQVANEQRRRAEIERQHALVAQERAVEASKVADNQRSIAEKERSQAEHSKRVADTLSYISLGRTLASASLKVLDQKNLELAHLLAYAAYLYTDRYKGDVYFPSVYMALTSVSQSVNTWARHKGNVMNIDFFSADHLVSASTYGEIMEHHIRNEQLTTKTLFSNNKFDFRDILIKNGNIYAVSRSGHVVIIDKEGAKTVQLDQLLHPMGITPMGDDLLLVIGEKGMLQLDPKTYKVVKYKDLPFKVVYYNRYDYSPALFDNQQRMHTVRTMEKIETTKLNIPGQVTAFASSKGTGSKAYGMMDGSLYFVDKKGKTTKLFGHRSRVTKIKINNWQLYSSSYDGTIQLYMADKAKIEPIELFSIGSWILNFTFDSSKHNIWTANQNGTLTEVFISVPLMVLKLKSLLKRNLTREEWNFYIGQNIPYETFIGKEAHP